MRKYIHKLPGSILERLRSVRDDFSITLFKTRIATHNYGDIQLKLKIADSMSASWYDQECGELPEITFLKQRKLKRGARVFDIGAHQAIVAITLAKIVGEAGTVVALEPGKFNFKIAVENKNLNRANNLILINRAISEHSGEVTFSEGINGRISSSGKRVKSFSIDRLIQLYGQPDVIFLDVEGYEYLALRSSVSAINSRADWFVEIHAGCGLESFGGSPSAIVDIFRSAGYSLYIQRDIHYKGHFEPLTRIPKERFFLIATQ